MDRQPSKEQLKHTLEAVYPQLTRISEAPNFSGKPEKEREKERTRPYKAIDNFGNIYFVQNQTSLRIYDKDGKIYVRRRPQKLMMNAKEAIRAAGKVEGDSNEW